jgi:hypothetical protein
MTRIAPAALVLALAAAPALAGELYIPYAIDRDNGAVRHRAEVMITNTQPSLAQQASHRLISGERREKAGQVTLRGGETKTLRGTAANGARGVLELDLAEGMAVRARLVTERSNGSRSVVDLPLVSQRNAVGAGGLAILQGLERTYRGRTSGVGVINLGKSGGNCSVGYQSAAGAPIGAATQFPLAAGTEIFFEDVLGAYREEIDFGAVANVQCTERFYAYAVVEDDAEGEVEFVTPSYESLVALAPAASVIVPRPLPTNSTIFTLPGTYLNCTKFNHNWRYNMRFGEAKTFRKAIMDFDVYVASWDKQKPSGTHCLFWLNMGSSWSNMFGYLNSTGTKGGTRFGVNYGGGDFRDGKSGGVRIGRNYHVSYAYDGPEKEVWFKVTSNGSTTVQGSYNRTSSQFNSSTFFIEFGSQTAPEGPEAKTYGWKFSNFRGEFVP